MGAVIRLARVARDLALKLLDFLWIITRDLLIPILSLTVACVAITYLASATNAYVVERAFGALGSALLWIAVLLAAQIAFLSAKTRVHPARLFSNQMLLLLWFSPYAMTLFLFASVSLSAIGFILVRGSEAVDFRLGVGPLTFAAIILAVPIVVYAVVRRHRDSAEEPQAEHRSHDT